MSAKTSTLPTLTIPRQAVLEGSLQYPGDIVLEGTLLGDVRCRTLVISERGAVDGTVAADAATVMGEASGAIYATQVVLKTACSVTADIFHQSLLLENGCYFEGKSRRVSDPVSLMDFEGNVRGGSDGHVR